MAKSLSGGVIVRGTHFLKGWSRTQQCITLSSAEAELVAMCKLSAELLGVLSMLKDLGESKTGTVLADSTAALAIADRKGSGKLRHINIRLLWIQERKNKEELTSEKVLGTENPADLLTKPLPRLEIDGHLKRIGLSRATGRAETAPRADAVVDTTLAEAARSWYR